MNDELRNSYANRLMYASFLQWAITNKAIVAKFRGETGSEWFEESNRPSLKDEDSAIMRRFVEWVTENVWGQEYAPDKLDEVTK